jgi:hypothetical protein
VDDIASRKHREEKPWLEKIKERNRDDNTWPGGIGNDGG